MSSFYKIKLKIGKFTFEQFSSLIYWLKVASLDLFLLNFVMNEFLEISHAK